MFFLNLTAGEFMALLGVLGGLVTALYLLDRAKRKKIVSTLHFWTSATAADEKQTRKRMRDPWSLILQLVSLCLLLLAIAQLQWGTREGKEHNHVLLLDTSAWSAERHNARSVLDREKDAAEAYIAAIPPRDRVMIVFADALARPVIGFTNDRTQLRAALNAAASGYSALNVNQALSYAQQAQTWSGGQPGEIVYIGPKQADSDEPFAGHIANLRVIDIPLARDNAGIQRVAVKRGDEAAGEWQASISVKNYGSTSRRVRLNTRFGATVFAPRLLNLAPGQDTVAEYVFVTNSPGELTAQLEPPDALTTDNSVTLALPRNGLLRVAVYTARAGLLGPLLQANPHVSATFYSPAEYNPNPPDDVVLLDQFAPGKAPQRPSLWIAPPREGSPLPVKAVVENSAVTAWNSNTALGTGLHEKDTKLPRTDVFETFQGDITVANTEQGAVVAARPPTDGRPKLAVIGFDPLEGDIKFHVTTPLLFANLFHWLSPEALRTLELQSVQVGSATVSLEPTENADRIRVSTDEGQAVPFTVHDHTLELFTARPAIVHITSFDRERTLSLTLPDVAVGQWKPPIDVRTGLPFSARWTSASVSLWQWFALLGAAGLLVEWMLFGRRRARKRALKPVASKSFASSATNAEQKGQLVSR